MHHLNSFETYPDEDYSHNVLCRMNKVNIFADLKNVPLEIRNRVYDEATEPLEILEHPKGFQGTIIEYFLSLLPQHLRSDSQIANEATMALLRRTLQTATTIKVPGPEYFDPIKSSGMQWFGVRSLEFTNIQQAYASPSIGDTPGKLTAHDIVSRCPNLEVLIFRIYPNMMLKPISPSSKRQSKKSGDCTHLFRIMEHPKIGQLKLNCESGNQEFTGCSAYAAPVPPSTAKFVPFVEAFREQARLSGRNIELTIDFSPDIVEDPHNPEMQRCHESAFTWIAYHDFFG